MQREGEEAWKEEGLPPSPSSLWSQPARGSRKREGEEKGASENMKNLCQVPSWQAGRQAGRQEGRKAERRKRRGGGTRGGGEEFRKFAQQAEFPFDKSVRN